MFFVRSLASMERFFNQIVQFYAKDGEKLDEEVQGLDVGKLRRILTKDLGCRASEEEEKEEKENEKIIAQPGPGTIKDKKTN